MKAKLALLDHIVNEEDDIRKSAELSQKSFIKKSYGHLYYSQRKKLGNLSRINYGDKGYKFGEYYEKPSCLETNKIQVEDVDLESSQNGNLVNDL